jgi:signal transduction histidine kinase/CheY-like chemotaxis protein
MRRLFKSRITLKYENEDLEKEYTQMRHKSLKLYNIIYSSISLAFSIVNTVLFTLCNLKEPHYLHSKYSTYITTAYFVIIFLFSVLTSKPKIQEYTSYINFFFFLYPFFCFNVYLTAMPNVDPFYHILVYTMLSLYNLVWYFSGTIDFMEGSIIDIAILVATYMSTGPVYPLNLHFRFSIHAIIVLIELIFTYSYVYEKKKAFYFNKKLESQNLWYDSIIQNMDSGFIKVQANRIIFINKTLYDKLNSIEEFCNIDMTSNIKRLYNAETSYLIPSREECAVILRLLFSNLLINDSQYKNENNWVNCKNISKDINNNHQFRVIGTLKLHTNSSQIYYEVLSRFKYSKDNEEVYEFMFKDISASKINAELKYKTLFLSKIAHEFKNPLLSIHEFINQIRDILSQASNYEKLKAEELLQSIESISDYLIILIKDMDFFSQKTSEKPTELVKDKVNLNDIIIFCKNITEALIKKSHKNIIFKVQFENCPSVIYTDEIMLKEVLINLLSNAVKFTNVGYILLKISTSNNQFIEFQVQDTGRGISSSQKAKLFQPFFDDVITTKHPTGIGLGLGLYIVKELLSALGSELMYESEVNKGTFFAFKLLLGSEEPLCKPYKNTLTEPIAQLEDSRLSNYSNITKQIDCFPFLPHNEDQRTSLGVEHHCTCNYTGFNISFNLDTGYKYIILVDDETITRKSTMRLIDNYFNKITNLKVLEASDGFECLYLYYQAKKKGIELSCIISDETMDYLNGTECARILRTVYSLKSYPKIPFFLLTAYEKYNIQDYGIEEVFSKPLSRNHLKIIKAKILN